jgi:uncharacterized membrane protein YgcG
VKRILLVIGLSVVLGLTGTAPAQADVDDFRFSSFDATYALSADDDGRSVLRTTETLVAEFPDYDQNHGIIRELVDDYQGHSTDIELLSVTDETGTPRDFTSLYSGDFLVVTISADDYLRGTQTYVLTYVQRNVTMSTDGVEEFHWDTNGTGWAQSFDSVGATVTIDPALATQLTGAVDSVYGPAGKDDGEAATTRTPDGYRFDVANLSAGENLTFAIAFEPGTFTPRAMGPLDSGWSIAMLVTFVLTVLALIGTIIVRRTYLRDAPGRGIIIPQYVAPATVPLALSAFMLRVPHKATPAQMIALAIRGNLRLRESRNRTTSYDLQFVTHDGATAAERNFLDAMFGLSPRPGKIRRLDVPDPAVGAEIALITRRTAADAAARGYVRRLPGGIRFLLWAPTGFLALVTAFLALATYGMDFGGAAPIFAFFIAIAIAIAAIVVLSKTPLGRPGTELLEYLVGLRMYITLAEQDRLRYLQSPGGAVKVPVDATDRIAIVKLYEKLLPYAILFGNEKQWAAVLGRFYEETNSQPDWYSGSTAFNVAYFSVAIDSVSSSTDSSFSDSGGGSDGGGGSGDGGGGGGGGGD